jgi:hypothetical protein
MLLQEDVSSGADYYQQDLVDSVFGRGRNNKITCIMIRGVRSPRSSKLLTLPRKTF